MSENRRREQRYQVTVTAEVLFDNDVYEGVTKNMSAGGTNIEVEGNVADGAEVQLILILTQDGVEDPATPPLSVSATVMWTAPTDSGTSMVGLRFGQLSGEQKVALAGLLEA